VTGTPI